MSSIFNHRAPDCTAVNADRTAREQPRSAVSRVEERLAALHLKVAHEKRRLRDLSVREQSIREGVVGRAVWDLLEQGRLEHAVVGHFVVRRALQKRESPHFRGPTRHLAGTIRSAKGEWWAHQGSNRGADD